MDWEFATNTQALLVPEKYFHSDYKFQNKYKRQVFFTHLRKATINQKVICALD